MSLPASGNVVAKNIFNATKHMQYNTNNKNAMMPSMSGHRCKTNSGCIITVVPRFVEQFRKRGSLAVRLSQRKLLNVVLQFSLGLGSV